MNVMAVFFGAVFAALLSTLVVSIVVHFGNAVAVTLTAGDPSNLAIMRHIMLYVAMFIAWYTVLISLGE